MLNRLIIRTNGALDTTQRLRETLAGLRYTLETEQIKEDSRSSALAKQALGLLAEIADNLHAMRADIAVVQNDLRQIKGIIDATAE